MDLLQIPVSSLVVFLVSITMLWLLKRSKNQLLKNWYLLKTIARLLHNYHRNYEVLTSLFESVGETFPVKNRIFTCNPDNIEYILRSNFPNFSKGPDFIESVDIFGEGLFRMDSHFPQWQVDKRRLNLELSFKDFRSFVANVSQKEVEFALVPLLQHLYKERCVVDLQDVFLRFGYNNSFNMLFGINLNLLSSSFPVNEFAEATDVVMETIIYRLLVPPTFWKLLCWLNLGWEGRYSKASKAIDHMLHNLISLKREDMAKGVAAGNDLMSAFMKSQGGGENDKFLRDLAFNVVFAASDTTSSALTWFFGLVSQSPTVEAKIIDELNHVVQSKTSKIKVFDQEEVKNLVYLHAAFCESMRLFPPVFMNQRYAAKDDVLPDGSTVMAGSKIRICVHISGRIKRVWGEDCNEFKPERWINEDGKIRPDLMSKWFIFNVGPRSCMGRDMAFTNMKMVAATILFNFNVQVVEFEPNLIKKSMVLFLEGGLKVKLSEKIV